MIRDQERLGDLQAAVVEPKCGHEMEGHAGIENAFIATSEGHCALSPVGWIRDADCVAATTVFLKTQTIQSCIEGIGDVFASVARLGSFEAGIDSLKNRLHSTR